MAPSYKEIVERARAAFNKGKTRPLEFRRQQLLQLQKMYREHREVFIEAVKTDLNKPRLEAIMFETNAAENEMKDILKRLDKFYEDMEVPSTSPGDKSYIIREPYGVALVMGAWNYPFQLTLNPLAGAIATGNAAVIKPSEVSSASEAAIARLVPQYLDQECYPVVCGGVAETTELLKERFDYIFYTGNTTVGRIVRQAANKYLTPTTLEMGGKSPCYIDDTVDVDVMVRRVLWGKLFNLGQTCIAPDYILCSKAVQEAFVQKAKEVLKEWYGDNPKESPYLCRIVAERHVDRLASYLSSGKIAIGGGYDKKARWMEPTVLVDVPKDSKIMSEEIFGPILPFVNVNSPQEAIEFVNKGEKPLAMYIFSTKESDQQMIIRQVSAGGFTVNDVLQHSGNPNLPFGGVGYSGMGSYHGDYTFMTFTHLKPVLVRQTDHKKDNFSFRFPPYTKEKENLILPKL